MARGNRRRWAAVTAVAVAGVVAAAAGAASVGGDATPAVLTVAVTDAGTRHSSACPADRYAGTFFDGARVVVHAGAETLTRELGPVRASGRGCGWTVTAPLPDAEEYVIEVHGTDRAPHVYRYTAEELAGRDHALWISVVA